MKKIILLTGFMGSGKSFLIKKFQREFKLNKNVTLIDLDSEVLKSSSATSVIEMGLKNFRREEQKVFKKLIKQFSSEVSSESTLVIGLGGGTLNEKAFNFIATIPLVQIVWLNVPFEVCYKRIQDEQKKTGLTRPLLKKGEEHLMRLYEKRKSFYSRSNIKLSLEEIDKINTFHDLLKYLQK
ncbi:MAG: AAA family ATPase [Oligoflexia bacterium]|nr:AAA family ATPase [Oligoflexia bacterium]